MGYLGKRLKLLFASFALLLCFTLIGCGDTGNSDNQFSVNVAGYDLVYNGNVKLGKVMLKTDDLDEIVELYQEIGDDVRYRDSLLIAGEYAQGLGVNAFAQANLDTLESKGLTLSNIKKTQIKLEKKMKNVDAVLVDYEVSEGLIDTIPLLYVSQLFIQDGSNIKLVSFVTEDSSSHSYAVKMLKNIN